MNTRMPGFLALAFFLGMLFLPSFARANDLEVTNVRLGQRDANAKTLAVMFDLSWGNSWRNKINHDAAWITVRLEDAQASTGEKKLCPLSASGVNPAGASRGTNSDLEIVIPADKIGAILRRAANHSIEDVATTSVMLTVNYDACGFTASSEVKATVIALEMVYVPEGSFFAGDFGTSSASLVRGSADNSPWPIASEAAINVTAAASNGFYYVSAGNAQEYATGAAFTVPAAYPKGYNAFYAMKYEITEGEWVAFVNSLAPSARSRRDLTNATHKNSDAVLARNTLACSGTPLVCTTEKPSRAVSYLAWQDLCAFLDWSGLRPLTELEFEKAARGPLVPVNGEYAWGTATTTAAAAIVGSSEDGTETVTTPSANARFDAVLLTGGDAANGPEYRSGPLRVGIFATNSSDRALSGAAYHGAMDFSGNLKEWCVAAGTAAGLSYSGVNGDGILTTAVGFEGNADAAFWPGMDADVTHGVAAVAGSGFRGGSWSDIASRLTISDRSESSCAVTDAAATYGGRGARSAVGL